MNIRTLKEQLNRAKSSTLNEIQWLQDEKKISDNNEYDSDLLHDKGHLDIIKEVELLIQIGESIKFIKDYLKKIKHNSRVIISEIDSLYSKANNELLFNEDYFIATGRYCEANYIIEIIKGKKYYQK